MYVSYTIVTKIETKQVIYVCCQLSRLSSFKLGLSLLIIFYHKLLA